MTDEKKKMTAQGSSVGADDGQSISQITENSIPTSGQKSNDEIVNSQDSLPESLIMHIRLHLPKYSIRLYRSLASVFQALFRR